MLEEDKDAFVTSVNTMLRIVMNLVTKKQKTDDQKWLEGNDGSNSTE